MFQRREFCKLAAAAACNTSLKLKAATASPLQVDSEYTPGWAVSAEGTKLPPSQVQISLRLRGRECHPVAKNVGTDTVHLREVVLLQYMHTLPPATAVYGEGFQMLTQTAGTLGHIQEIGYKEQKHYRIPGPTDAAVVTSLLVLTPPEGPIQMLAYTSCRRFSGRFYLREGTISVVVDTEGLALQPGESFGLESFLHLEGTDRTALLAHVADRLNANHPHRPFRPVPMGWCSWYSFATETTAEDVSGNLSIIREQIPELTYIQIDDGYQPAMGDWLEPGHSFGGNVQDVFKKIRAARLQPALWVAPFIASKDSIVLREHPEWFVQNSSGQPMPAAEVTFTGWGSGKWYCLDGTHPGVQQHLEQVFRVMREQWGCTYFKLDANFWGAVHGGRFHDPKATRIEAYRRGMDAVRRGAADAFLLGCNHPIWPSIGTIDGSRSSGDISRRWSVVSGCMEQSMHRNWQNGRLWWNDPDAVLLEDRESGPMQGQLTEEELRFHATSAYASGGMMLSGDDLRTLPAPRFAMLHKLVPPTGVAAIFENPATLEVGRIRTANGWHIAVFNRTEQEKQHHIPLSGRWHVQEIWTGTEFGTLSGAVSVVVPAHGARLLLCTMAGR